MTTTSTRSVTTSAVGYSRLSPPARKQAKRQDTARDATRPKQEKSQHTGTTTRQPSQSRPARLRDSRPTSAQDVPTSTMTTTSTRSDTTLANGRLLPSPDVRQRAKRQDTARDATRPKQEKPKRLDTILNTSRRRRRRRPNAAISNTGTAPSAESISRMKTEGTRSRKRRQSYRRYRR